ncbi:MAG: type III-B CRISPR module RAMP protein Cmr1 [Gemmataceae bacterium]
MPRDIPEVPNDMPAATVADDHVFEMELITPLFGGGVEPRKNETSFPIRPTEIRGQLEFWWRATAGARYDAVRALREAQTNIWGSTERASRVIVSVELGQVDSPKPCAKYEPDRNNPKQLRSIWLQPFNIVDTSLPYALFPFQGQLGQGRSRVEVPPAECIQKATFKLHVQCPADCWPEVEQAVRAWTLFGGLGSRTRRGCGAIACAKLNPKDRNDLLQHAKQLAQSSHAVRQWPTLAAAILVGKEFDSAIAAWNEAIRVYQKFRQGVGIGRNPGQQNRAGRSRWPEPETIRRVTKRRAQRHQRLEQIPDDAFPRAELGLPIVFHFKFKDRGDPEDTVLYPGKGPDGESRERMASPLILKAVKLANNKFVPVIVQLRVPPLDSVDLRQGNQSLPLPNPIFIRGKKLAEYPNSPMSRLSQNGSALEAFIHFAVSQGFVRA